MEDDIVARGDTHQAKLDGTIYSSAGLGLTRDTRATVDQVLDPKTVEVLQKMQKQGVFSDLAGCISTGKEANVYFGVLADGESCVAVKVYKTSILGFRDRDEYVDGEYRFRNGYCKSNPRKMVSLWAEKEQRNLLRLSQAGLNAPRVIRCKRNVLVMSLVGRPAQAAPRLKDVSSEPGTTWRGVYFDVVRSMRKMYQQCRLVHGDLSEYNMLLDFQDNVFIIDVSQSVGLDHPRSLEFLKRDVNLFFERIVSDVIPLQVLFAFIVGSCSVRRSAVPTVDTGDEKLPGKITLSPEEERTLGELSIRDYTDADSPQFLADSVFMETYIPSSLAEAGGLGEIEKIMDDRSKGMATVYDTLLNEEQGGSESPVEGSDSGSESESLSSYESSGNEGSTALMDTPNGQDGHRPDGVSRQEWKRIVKEQQKEKRKAKVPKHLKHKRNLKKYGCK